MEKLLENPINSLPLEQLIKDKTAEKVLIIVNDITRPIPYNILLPPLLKKLEETGIRRDDITFLIATGVIVPHYIAGFSGGRKSIHPGICARKTIEKNHSQMVHPKAATGNLIDNPVHEEMLEAALKVNVDFNINTITDEDSNIIDIVAGELHESWSKGVEICKDTYIVPIKEKADVVFASAGGYPKDINIYQAQKALDNAYHAVKPGGTIVLVAECREGIGNTVCEQWINEANSIQDIEQRLKKCFILGGHKAYAIAKVAKEADIILLSSLNKELTKKLFMEPAENIEQAIKWVREKHGDGFRSYIIPSGCTILPQIKRGYTI